MNKEENQKEKKSKYKNHTNDKKRDLDKLLNKGIDKLENQDIKEIESNELQNIDKKEDETINNEINMDELYKKISIELEKNIVNQVNKKIDNITEALEDKVQSQIYRCFNNRDHKFEEINEKFKSISKYDIYKPINNKISLAKDSINSQVSYIKKDVEEIKKNNSTQLDKLVELSKENNKQLYNLKEGMSSLKGDIECIQGQINTLRQFVEDKFEEMNTNNNKNQLKPCNLEEEVLINLGEYGQRIVEELTMVSRNYAVNKDKIENVRITEEKHAQEIEKQKKHYKSIGKSEIISKIYDKYSDGIEDLLNRDTMEAIFLSELLRNEGLEEVEEFSIGKEIEITDENRVALESMISFANVGKYKIIKSAYILNGKIKQKAQVEEIKLEEVKE